MGLSATATPEPRRLGAPLIALALLLAGAWFLNLNAGFKQVLLLIVGAALGLTLYHAAFGFTAAWRVFINERRGAGLRAQMVMLTLAVLLFFRHWLQATCSATRSPGWWRRPGCRWCSAPSSSASACSSAAAAPRARCSPSAAATRGCW